MKIVTAFLTVAINLATVQASIAATTTPKPVTPQQPQPTPKRGDGRRIYIQMVDTWQPPHRDTSK